MSFIVWVVDFNVVFNQKFDEIYQTVAGIMLTQQMKSVTSFAGCGIDIASSFFNKEFENFEEIRFRVRFVIL